MNQDEEHLKLLSTFHYVLGGVTALFSLFPVIHLVVGLFFILAPEKMSSHGEPPPAFFGWVFVIGAGVAILGGLTLAVLIAVSGRFLSRRVRRVFCIVVAGLECLFMPLGTILGVFTIIVLMRPSVNKLFAGAGTPET